MRLLMLFFVLGVTPILFSPAQEEKQETRINKLVQDLSAGTLDEREEATNALIEIGAPAKPHIGQALISSDPEIRMRAEIIWSVMEKTPGLSFSKSFLSLYPNIYHELFTLNTDPIYEIILDISKWDDEHDKPIHNDIQDQDITGCLQLLARLNFNGLGADKKRIIIHTCVKRDAEETARRGYSTDKEGRWRSSIPSAAPYLAHFLKDKNDSVRASAVRALGIVGANEYAKDLAALLSDRNEEVRQNIITALADLNATEYAHEIVPLLKDGSTTNWAYPALCKMKTEKSVEALRSLLKEKGHGACRQAVEILQTIDAREAKMDLIALVSDERNPDDFRRIADTLVAWNAVEAAPELAKRLNDESGWIRLHCMWALGNLGARDYAKDIVPFLKDDREVFRKYAVKILIKFNNPEIAKDILNLLNDSNSELYECATQILSQTKNPVIERDIIMFLKDPNARKRGMAARILGAWHASLYSQEIAGLLKDGESIARGAAARALGNLGDRKYIPDLAGLLKDWNEDVRIDAVFGLSTIDARDQIPAIASLLKDPNFRVRRAAIKALATWKATEYKKEIAAFLDDEKLWKDAMLALGKLEAIEYAKNLADRLQEAESSNFSLRNDILYHSIRALSQMKAKDYAKKIAPLVNTRDEFLTMVVAFALSDMDAGEYIPQLVEIAQLNSDFSGRYYRAIAIIALIELGHYDGIPSSASRDILALLRAEYNAPTPWEDWEPWVKARAEAALQKLTAHEKARH